ncbi:MAG: carboxypeptidase-like regulatory domain-containing protein [Bacteroidota bacterium]
MKRNLIRNILGGLGFTTALFIFQACYGTPQDLEMDILVEGKVTSQDSGTALPGIRVMVGNDYQTQYTDNSGVFSFYTLKQENITLHFSDPDSIIGGWYHEKDTLIPGNEDYCFLDIQLEKQAE